MSFCINILLIVSILLIIVLYYINDKNRKNYQYNKHQQNNQNQDTFISQKDENAYNDGNMKFDYLIKKNYTNNVLKKYYLNDDTKINGIRIVYHPYMKKNHLNLYGNPNNQYSTRGRWGNYDTYSEYILNNYGVRR